MCESIVRIDWEWDGLLWDICDGDGWVFVGIPLDPYMDDRIKLINRAPRLDGQMHGRL